MPLSHSLSFSPCFSHASRSLTYFSSLSRFLINLSNLICPVFLNLVDHQWPLAPSAIGQHARILLQARLVPFLVPVIRSGPWGRSCCRSSQPGCGDWESSGPPTDIQLCLTAGIGRTGYVLRGGGQRPPAVSYPAPPVAACCLGQRHTWIGGAVVMGSCHWTEEKKWSVWGAAGWSSSINHRPGPLLHGWITVTQGKTCTNLQSVSQSIWSMLILEIMQG